MNIPRLLVPAFIVILLFSGCSRGGNSGTGSQSGAADETAAATAELSRDIKVWNEAFPLQTASNEMNRREELSPTGYNGSVPFQRWDLTPEIRTNFQGIAFSKDYKEDRGHVYAWDDLFETERTSEKTPGACITCKTSDIDLVFEERGWDYASDKMVNFAETAHAGIDCFTCHDPDTGHLRVVQPAMIEALERYGLDPETLSERDLRTYVCAQCHSEYYFEPGTKRVIFPWQNGLAPDEMYSYYQEQPAGFTGDYTNPVSEITLLKVQHPDYEMFFAGTHAAAGASCADCHMPQIQVSSGSGTETITQHWITSPLRTVESSCLPCHEGQEGAWLLSRVQYIQDSVFGSMRRAGLAIEEAHRTFEKAYSDNIPEGRLTAAKELLREAQWYWDFTASANSTGFHNSELAHSNLSTAIDLAYKSITEVLLAYP